MPNSNKTVYLTVPGVSAAYVWTATQAQAADLVSRWNAARSGGGPDALIYTQGGYEYHVDLTAVAGLLVSA